MPAPRRVTGSRRRSLASFDGAQLGDAKVRDMAGGNIYNGVSPEHLVALLHELIGDTRQYRRLELIEREQRRAEVDETIGGLREQVAELRRDHEDATAQIRADTAAIRQQIGRIVADLGQYRAIGVSADAAVVGQIRAQLAQHAAWIAAHRLALIALALAVAAAVGLLVWHLAAARPILGAAAALLAARLADWRTTL